MLSKDQKKKLRSLSHEESTLVFVGKKGLTENLFESFEISLLAHNLVKVKIQKESETSPEEVVEALTDRFSVELVSKTGKVLVFFRDSVKGRIRV